MEINANLTAMSATQNLMDCRRQLKEVKEREKQLKKDFAAAILLDAIEQPSRVLRLDRYWRMTGLLPMEVERMVVDLIQDTDCPDFFGLKTMRHAVRIRYAEFDEAGNPTGGFISQVSEVPIIVNLGEVKRPRNKTEWDFKPVMGAHSLVEQLPLCKKSSCYYVKKGTECPNTKVPGTMWKCSSNWEPVQNIINKILNNLPG